MKDSIRVWLHIWTLAIMTFLSLSLAGCMKRELETPVPEPESGAVEIAFAWPEGQKRPASSRLRFYAEDGTLYRVHDGLTDGYTGTLPEGAYRLLLHNTDATGVGYAGMGYHTTAETYALGISGGVPQAGELLTEPHKVYGIGHHDQGEVFTIQKGKTTRLSISAPMMTKELTFYFTVTGLDEVKAITGTLHGVSPSMSLCTGECRLAAFSQPFAAKPRAAQKYSHKATLTLFDLLTNKDSPAQTNTMDIAVTAPDDRVYTVKADVTGALQQIIGDNEGKLPIHILLNVEVEVNPVSAEVGVIVKPWDDTGTGGGEPKSH